MGYIFKLFDLPRGLAEQQSNKILPNDLNIADYFAQWGKMKIKLNDLLIVIYLILLSIVLKEFLYIPLSIAVLVFLLGLCLKTTG